jgi:hypothetical protein
MSQTSQDLESVNRPHRIASPFRATFQAGAKCDGFVDRTRRFRGNNDAGSVRDGPVGRRQQRYDLPGTFERFQRDFPRVSLPIRLGEPQRSSGLSLRSPVIFAVALEQMNYAILL